MSERLAAWHHRYSQPDPVFSNTSMKHDTQLPLSPQFVTSLVASREQVALECVEWTEHLVMGGEPLAL